MSQRSKGADMKTPKKAPEYAYYDNPLSRYGMISDDLNRSPPYRALSNAARSLYVDCTTFAETDAAKEILFNRLQEINAQCQYGWSDEEIKNGMVYPRKTGTGKGIRSGLFVFPKKYYEQYGYTKSGFCKYMRQLIKSGFIKIRWDGGNQYAVNVYQFDTAFKAK